MTVTVEDNLVEVAMNLLELLSKCVIRWISNMFLVYNIFFNGYSIQFSEN